MNDREFICSLAEDVASSLSVLDMFAVDQSLKDSVEKLQEIREDAWKLALSLKKK